VSNTVWGGASQHFRCCEFYVGEWQSAPKARITSGGSDPQDNPEVTLQSRQKTEILLNCLSQLSPGHREVIDLVYYHEKSIDEVAEVPVYSTRREHARAAWSLRLSSVTSGTWR
jgi:DNA-directed RNA polymerase specialized sigma24 family protein